jgi:phosphatidate cytidylyltransferase
LRFLIIVGAATAFADAGGLMFGSWLKGPKLAPKVSPGKTWSGVLGSLAASIIGVCLFWPIAPKSWSLGTLMLLVLAVTIGATALKFLDLWGLVSGFPGSGHGLAACWSRRRDGIRCP